MALSRRPVEFDADAESRWGRHEGTHDHWQIGRLRELARRGSLAAGRELLLRAITQCERASNLQPGLLDPYLCEWLTDVLRKVASNPRQSIGHLIAPARERLRPSSHAELVRAMSLDQEAYYRVRKAVDEGIPLKTVLPAVAAELNALGYRTSNNEPLQAATIRYRYYAVSQRKRRDAR